MKKNFIAGMLFLLVSNVSGQSIFSETYYSTINSGFILENTQAIAKIDLNSFISTINTKLPQKIRDKIVGTINFQILVDGSGKSCLLSVDNKTNTTSRMMNIKQIIDGNVIWQNTKETVSTFVSLIFNKGKVVAKRMGIGANSDLHELNE